MHTFLYCMIALIFIHHGTFACSIPSDQIFIRLKKIFVCLSECLNHNAELGICMIEFPEELVLPPYCNFTNPKIIECQKDISITKSVIPLIVLWEEEDISTLLNQDDIFLREFLILVYQASGELMMNSLSAEASEHMRDIVSHIVSVYQKIDSLPLEEILNAIDILADEMPHLLEKYELTSSMTWGAWFHKYWWAPPLILGTIMFKIWIQSRLQAHKLQFSETIKNAARYG